MLKKKNPSNPGRGAIEYGRAAPEIDKSFRVISGRHPEDPCISRTKPSQPWEFRSPSEQHQFL